MLFTSQVGYYFIYSFRQFILKEEIEKKLLATMPESSLEVFVVEDMISKIRWEEKNKEFSLDGVMYDVARIRMVEGKTYLYCLNDKKEKELLKDLVNAVDKNSSTDKQSTNVLKAMVPDIVCEMNYQEPVCFVTTNQYISFNEDVLSRFLQVISPPPKS